MNMKLPKCEGHQHPDRAVREIEDPGSRVGNDQPTRRHRVDGTRDDAGNGEGQELGHGITVLRGPDYR